MCPKCTPEVAAVAHLHVQKVDKRSIYRGCFRSCVSIAHPKDGRKDYRIFEVRMGNPEEAAAFLMGSW
eukprot:scaffold161497_cov15-Tisochrysis_lutea.AAC.1